ncbi:hypothetical protein EBU71_04595 [bacterium]|nr:hypothetical protein [Candidatus Elulimicrobium humile]
MDKKVQFGQFYTTNSHYIIGNLIPDLSKDLVVVEPFCGKGDLLIFDNKYEIYDIDPKIENCENRDTLKNPPDYTGKLVVTNPPFLAKNKNRDKTLYDLYEVGDLYKASIKSIFPCSGGILIVPLNFFCDEDNSFREKFFSRFDIIRLNIFEETVFDDTTYTICSFSFKRKENGYDENKIECNFFPSKEIRIFDLKKSSGYRFGSNFLEIINSVDNIGIKRLTIGKTPNSNLYLRAIDTGSQSGRISLTINEKHFFGKESDRTFATLIMDKYYTTEQEEKICNEFNRILEEYRREYNSMFLTNYRNSSTYARKRISFDVAYKLISYIIKKENF